METENARIFHSDDGQPASALLEHEGTVNSLAFSPDGSRLVSGSDDKTARIWNAENREGEQTALSMIHDDPVIQVGVSPDNRSVFTLTENAVRLWDLETGQPISDFFPIEGTAVAAMFSSAGDAIIGTTKDGRVIRWELPIAPVPRPVLVLRFGRIRRRLTLR